MTKIHDPAGSPARAESLETTLFHVERCLSNVLIRKIRRARVTGNREKAEAYEQTLTDELAFDLFVTEVLDRAADEGAVLLGGSISDLLRALLEWIAAHPEIIWHIIQLILALIARHNDSLSQG